MELDADPVICFLIAALLEISRLEPQKGNDGPGPLALGLILGALPLVANGGSGSATSWRVEVEVEGEGGGRGAEERKRTRAEDEGGAERRGGGDVVHTRS